MSAKTGRAALVRYCVNGHDILVVGRHRGGSCTACRREESRRYAASPEGQAKGRAYREANKDHINARIAKWQADNREHVLEHSRRYMHEKRLREHYRMTVADYHELLASQDGKCAICGVEPEPGYALRVDHDHGCCPGKDTCGRCIRGLLCGECNRGIGSLRDDPNLLRRAVAYLERG